MNRTGGTKAYGERSFKFRHRKYTGRHIFAKTKSLKPVEIFLSYKYFDYASILQVATLLYTKVGIPVTEVIDPVDTCVP
jgi:hypothetical protein